MAANKETRILKTNTLEQFRQKANEVSLHLGDNEQLNANLADKTYNFVDVSAGAFLFQNTDDDSKVIRYELKPEETLDNTGGYIVLKDVSNVTGFNAGDTLTQTGGYSATVVSSSIEKILVKNSSGTFNTAQDISDGTNTIAAANVDRIIAEAYSIGVVRVYKNGTELSQNLLADGFHTVSIAGRVPLSGNPDVTDVTEGTVLNQSNGFTGTVLRCTSSLLIFKNTTNAGSFSAGANLRFSDNTTAINASNHGALTTEDTAYGTGIELNTPAAANDDIKIFSMDAIAGLNELQDDIGVTENLTTTATNLVAAINEHDAELGTITSGAMGTTASTVSGAIAEHENQIGNENITSIDSGSNTITGALNQLHTEVGSLSLNTTATDLTGAVNELEADLFNAEGADKRSLSDLLTTDNSSIVDAINELHNELFTSGVSFSGLSADDFKSAVQELRTELGDHTSLGTTATTSAVAAINEIEAALRGTNTDYNVTAGTNIRDGLNAVYADIHTTGSVTLQTDASHLVGGINELESAVRGTADNYTLNTSANDLVAAVNEHESDIGNMTLTGLTATDLSAGLRELRTELGDITAINASFANDSNLVVALNELQTEVGANAYPSGGPADAADATNLTNAINAIDAEIGDTNYSGADITTAVSTAQTNIGTIGNLDTTATNLVLAVNELHTEIGNNDTDIGNLMTLIDGAATVDSSIAFGGAIAATNIKSAIQELDTEKVALTSSTQQNINSEIQFTGDISFVDGGTNADTFTFGTGTTLDLSAGSLLLPGNTSDISIFGTSFLQVDGNIEGPMGLSVDRAHVSTITDTTNTRVQWNEDHAESKPARGWQLKGLNDSSQSNTADIVTFYNAKELITSNTESGINVSWDATNQNFDFNVDDFTVTLGTGPISGNFTVTNLGNVTFNTTLDNNSVTLGTHTTGAYVRRILGTANEIEVSANDVENASVTIGLPNSVDIVDLDVTGTTQSSSSTTGALTVAGGVGIAKNLHVGGNLVVDGTQTILNTTTLEVEDTLVLAGNDLTSEPSSGGFGLEVGPITNPSGVASGVTGAHSIVYNYATDRWEADGSLVLSEATLGSPSIESIDFTSSRNLDFINGAGITVATALSGTDIDVTVTNTDKGSDQNIFKNVAVSGQTTIQADSNADTLTFAGLDAITVTTNATTDTISIDHDDVGAGAATYGQTSTEDGQYIKSIQVNDQGHVVAVTADDFDDRYVNEVDAVSANTANKIVKRDASGNFSAGTITAALSGTATNADNINVDEKNDNTNYQLLFSVNNGSGYQRPYIDSDNAHLLYNPSTHTLTAANFAGNATTATTATNAHNINVDEKNDNTNYQLLFSAVDGSGFQRPYIDTDNGHLLYNPSTHTLTVGTVSGNIAWANVTGKPGLDNYGSWQLYINNVSTDAITSGERLGFDEGTGIDISYDNNDITITHANTSEVENVNNNNNTFIQDLTFDEFGHVTNVGSAAVSIGNGQLSMGTSGNGISGSTTFTANQSGNATFTVTSNATTASTASTIAYRDSSGDITARLFRSEYDTTNPASNIGYIMTQVDTGNNNYIRPSTPAQVRGALNVADGATNTTQPQNSTITLTGENIYIGSDATNTTTTSEAFTLDQSTNETIYIRNAAPNVTTNLTTTQSGNTVRVNSSDGTNATIAVATTSNAGVMSTGDKSKLDNIESNAHNHAIYGYNDGTSGYVASNGLTGSNHIYLIGGTGISLAQATNYNGSGDHGIRINCDIVNTDTDRYVNSASFNTSNGILTLTRAGSDTATITVDLDGRFTDNGYADTMNQHLRTTDNPSFNNLHVDQLGVGTAAPGTDGMIRATNDIIAFYSSDRRLKENIKPLENALDKVSQISGVEFDWKPLTAEERKTIHGNEGHDVGVIAQEVEQVLPEVVTERDTGYKAVNYEKIVPLLIEAIKELKEENNQLRAEIEALKDINS